MRWQTFHQKNHLKNVTKILKHAVLKTSFLTLTRMTCGNTSAVPIPHICAANLPGQLWSCIDLKALLFGPFYNKNENVKNENKILQTCCMFLM